MVLSKQFMSLDLKAPRPADSFEAALTDALDHIGPALAAERLGCSESLLRKWTDPARAQRPSLEQGFRIDALYTAAAGASVDAAPIASLWRRRLLAVNRPSRDLAAPGDELMDVVYRIGLLSHALRASLSDGWLSPNEKEALRIHVREARRELDELSQAIERG